MVRVYRESDDGKQTLGRLVVTENMMDVFSCATLELPWRDNATGASCIPKGVYMAEKLQSSGAIKYPHIWIKDVPGRSGIKIHRANYVEHLRGCIGVGKTHADIDGDGDIDITSSTDTLNRLMSVLPDQFVIEIS